MSSSHHVEHCGTKKVQTERSFYEVDDMLHYIMLYYIALHYIVLNQNAGTKKAQTERSVYEVDDSSTAKPKGA